MYIANNLVEIFNKYGEEKLQTKSNEEYFE